MTQLAMERSDPAVSFSFSLQSKPANQLHANTHYREPIAMQNMQLLLHRPHHLMDAPPTLSPCFVPPPLMRVIFVRATGSTVSKHNSHSTSYYKSLACMLGAEPVIVAHGENIHKETKLGRKSLGRLMLFWLKNGRVATQKQGFMEHNSRNKSS